MKKSLTYYLSILITLLVLFNSCKDEPKFPLVEFYGKLEKYKITMKVKSAYVDTYAWDFGDGTTSEEREPVHNYIKGGAYTVTLDVAGPGGETSREKTFEVEIPLEELLTGGPAATNGKTWLVTDIYTPGLEGAGPFGDELKITQDAFENILNYFRLADQYKDEFIFYPDGTYNVNPADDGLILATMIFGQKTGTLVKPSRFPELLPLCASSYNPPTGGKWSLDYDDFTQSAAIYNISVFNYEIKDVTFHFKDSGNKVARLVFSDGQYLGIMGYSPVIIIKSIKANSMNVAIGVTTVANYWDKPSIMMHFTFVPKN